MSDNSWTSEEVGDHNNNWYLLSTYNVLSTVQALQILSYLILTSTPWGDIKSTVEMKKPSHGVCNWPNVIQLTGGRAGVWTQEPGSRVCVKSPCCANLSGLWLSPGTSQRACYTSFSSSSLPSLHLPFSASSHAIVLKEEHTYPCRNKESKLSPVKKKNSSGKKWTTGPAEWHVG